MLHTRHLMTDEDMHLFETFQFETSYELKCGQKNSDPLGEQGTQPGKGIGGVRQCPHWQ